MQESLQTGGRYPALKTIAVLYLIVSAVTAIAGIIYSFYLLLGTAGPWGNRVGEFFGMLAATFFVALAAVAVSEIIKLFIDIAHSAMTMAAPVVAPISGPVAENTTQYPNRIGQYANEETAEGALVRGR